MQHADQIDSVRERQIEHESLRETVSYRNPAHPLQAGIADEDRLAAQGLVGQVV